MGTPDIDTMIAWLRSHRLTALAGFVALEVVVSAPFLFSSATGGRGLYLPTLLLIGVTGAFVLGPRDGVALAAIGSVLGVLAADASLGAPVLWIALAALAGLAGDRLRAAEAGRTQLIDELQAGLMPHPNVSQRGGVSLAARYLPGENRLRLGGDFYGLVETGPGRASALVGDVSGHGSGAAAISTHLRAAWRALVLAGLGPVEKVEVLNRLMLAEQERTGPEAFATLCCVRIDQGEGVIQFVLAGHPPPLLLVDGRVAPLRWETGPPLGVADADAWALSSVELPRAPWSLLLYTDGLVEGRASDGSRERFGRGRLVAFLEETARGEVGETALDALLAEVERSNGGPVGDDVVVLSLSPAARTELMGGVANPPLADVGGGRGG